MRGILFRGKDDESKDFVYGLLSLERDCRNPKMLCTVKPCIVWEESGLLHSSFVMPETVGQYTGLTDKNGKQIFEGDMIKPFDDEIDKMVVEFRHGQFLLCSYGERGYMAEYGWEEIGNYGCFEAEPLSSYGDDIEVIGNIHDNSELLKGGDV